MRRAAVLQQRVGRRKKGVDDGYAAPGEAVMEVFAQEQAAAVFGGYGDDQCVPDGEAVIGGEVEGGLQGCSRTIGHRELL